MGVAPVTALEELKIMLVGVAGRKLRAYKVQEWLLVRPEDRAFDLPRSEMRVTFDSEYQLRLLGRIQRDYDVSRAQAVTLLVSMDSPIEFLKALGYTVESQREKTGFVVESLEGYRISVFVEWEEVKVEMRSECQQENLEEYLRGFCEFARLLTPPVTYTPLPS